LAAHSNADQLAQAACRFNVRELALGNEQLAAAGIGGLPDGAAVGYGAAAVERLATLPDVDIVVNALVGSAGLRASYAALCAGKTLALANKESLVVGGDLLMPLAGAMNCAPTGACDARSGTASALPDGRVQAAPPQNPILNSQSSIPKEMMINPVIPAHAGIHIHPTCDNGFRVRPGMTIMEVNQSSPNSPCGRLLPVDSEHSAIFQCLIGEGAGELRALWLTCSGGPFRGYSRGQLAEVTCEQALAHPTWNMGPKITVDSATLMNKGLEVIEAHHLFAVPYDAIQVVVHPQSCIHSAAAYQDGSIKAHLGASDMRIPIQYALSFPERWPSPEPLQLDMRQLAGLTFAAPDSSVFGCLELAIAAGRAGGTMPTVLNAANEVAVSAFLNKSVTLLDIERIVADTMQYHVCQPVESIAQLEGVDGWARAKAREIIEGSK